MDTAASRRRFLRYLELFLFGLILMALLGAAGTGLVVYLQAPASDLATSRVPFWDQAKYYFLDIHVTLSFVAIALLPVSLLLRGRRGRRPLGGGRISNTAFVLLGVFAAFGIARFVAEEHPIFVETLRATNYPSSAVPDEIVLTWAGDPQTTQSVNWRTRAGEPVGAVRYRIAGTQDAWSEAAATSETMTFDNLANDDAIDRHTAQLTGLAPGTAYEYEVGYAGGWTGARTFTTAPAAADAFSFLYIGDSQEGLLDYGALMEQAVAALPEAGFILHAGDLVNRGCDRDDWDLFFHASRNIYDRYTLVPAIGNHDDCDPLDPRLYTAFLDLPRDGSDGTPEEESYSFTYGNALFVVLNSNRNISAQAPWLEEQLKNTAATWKFVLWHHPAYASKEHRDNEEVRDAWGPLIDAYDVDIVFQGHDHAYMRTKPMRAGEMVGSPAEGTIYLVSVSGTKFYDQLKRDYMEVAFEKTPTYQTIRIDGNTLVYEAIDGAGKVVDAFTLTK